MDLDPQSQDTLLDLTIKLAESAAPLLLVRSKSKWKEMGGLIVGFKRAIKKLRYVTDAEILQMSESEYKFLVESHDYLLAIDIPQNIEKLSYFPLDVRNAGGFTMAVGPEPWDVHNFDVCVSMGIPGILPYMIRILSNRGGR